MATADVAFVEAFHAVFRVADAPEFNRCYCTLTAELLTVDALIVDPLTVESLTVEPLTVDQTVRLNVSK